MVPETSVMIDPGKVEWAKQTSESKKKRTFSKDFAEKLAGNMKVDGQLQPIIVRPHPDKADWYIGVAGRHRHYAATKFLKWDLIEAKVAKDMGDDDAEMAMRAENAMRQELTNAQKMIAIKEWWDYWKEKQKAHDAGAGADDAAPGEQSTTEGAGGDGVAADGQAGDHIDGAPGRNPSSSNADASDGAGEATEKGPTFPEVVAKQTNTGLTQAKRKVKIATSFTPEQHEVFEQMSVTEADQYTIAKVADQEKRDGIVALIAAGMPAAEAIAMPDAEHADPSRPAPRPEAELTDAEWLEKYCGDFRKLLNGNTARYDRDAIFYRQDSDARSKYKNSALRRLKDFTPKTCGTLMRLVYKVCHIPHPRDWMVCGTCKGAGKMLSVPPSDCRSCLGDGYTIKAEAPR